VYKVCRVDIKHSEDILRRIKVFVSKLKKPFLREKYISMVLLLKARFMKVAILICLS
jgi:hypothetical protein